MRQGDRPSSAKIPTVRAWRKTGRNASKKRFKFLTSGYHPETWTTFLNGATFSVHYDEMVGGEGHRILQLVRNTTCCHFSGKPTSPICQASECSGSARSPALVNMVRAAAANSGAHDQPDWPKRSRRRSAPEGVGVIIEGTPSLHADARRREAARPGGHERHARLVPAQQADARRILVAGPKPTGLVHVYKVDGRRRENLAARGEHAKTENHLFRRPPPRRFLFRFVPQSPKARFSASPR